MLRFWILSAVVLANFFVAQIGWCQRGVGQQRGVASQGIQPEVVEFTGKIVSVEKGKCELTTGRSLEGAHLMVEDSDSKEVNLHLGPANSKIVKSVCDTLQPGTEITISAFRTEKMKAGHMVAISIGADDDNYVLRGESLKPVWSGPRRGRRRY